MGTEVGQLGGCGFQRAIFGVDGSCIFLSLSLVSPKLSRMLDVYSGGLGEEGK
jgi:hypothetical protein